MESWREVHSNDQRDGRHFGTFLVELPTGAASYRDLADDMPRDVVKEVFGDLLSSTDSGYTLPYIPLSSPPDQRESPSCETSTLVAIRSIVN
jgi:hypothetical protein